MFYEMGVLKISTKFTRARVTFSKKLQAEKISQENS